MRINEGEHVRLWHIASVMVVYCNYCSCPISRPGRDKFVNQHQQRLHFILAALTPRGPAIARHHLRQPSMIADHSDPMQAYATINVIIDAALPDGTTVDIVPRLNEQVYLDIEFRTSK